MSIIAKFICFDKLKMIWILILFSRQIAARSGAFRSSFTRVGACATLTPPVDTDPPSIFYAELYNTTTDINLMRGNVTVVKNHKIKKMKAKSYLWENNKWKVNYIINNMGCNRVFFPVLCMATGVKYDTKTCSFFKGVYTFDSFNVNKIQHVWMSTQEYGKILWRIEVFSQIGAVFCYEYETLIEPVK